MVLLTYNCGSFRAYHYPSPLFPEFIAQNCAKYVQRRKKLLFQFTKSKDFNKLFNKMFNSHVVY